MIGNKLQENENIKPNSLEMRKLKETFPQYFNNKGEFEIDKFKDFLKQEEVEISKEGYELKFLGKSYAKYLSSLETETYISPDIEHNSKEENEKSENLYIVGDNIDAIKHLLSSYAGKIKCIYIDPPYNTGKDGFIYPDDFQFNSVELSQKLGITEEESTRILDLSGKSTHSAWLTFMYPRLVLARDLLSNDGVMFISIDENEYKNLSLICDEIFGEENFLISMITNKSSQIASENIVSMHEYILGYTKDYDSFTLGDNFKYTISRGTVGNEDQTTPVIEFPKGLNCYNIEDGIYTETRKIEGSKENIENFSPIIVKDGCLAENVSLRAKWRSSNDMRNFFNNDCNPVKAKINGEITEIYFENDRFNPQIKKRVREKFNSIFLENKRGSKRLEELQINYFDNPKDVNLIKYLIERATKSDSIVLDFFSGSATTADSVIQLNSADKGKRKYIMVQLPEKIEEKKSAYKAGYRTIDQIGRARIENASQKIKAETNADIDYGYKLYHLETPEEKTLMDLENFEPEVKFITDDMVSVFDNEHSSGKESILATWINEDGYGLTRRSISYKLENYQANLMDKSLYIIDEGLEDDDVMTLIKRIEDETLDITRVVVYVHSVRFSVLQELRKNLNVLRNNKNVSLIERF
jgi:adenine specific DNA methylase Mod